MVLHELSVNGQVLAGCTSFVQKADYTSSL